MSTAQRRFLHHLMAPFLLSISLLPIVTFCNDSDGEDGIPRVKFHGLITSSPPLYVPGPGTGIRGHLHLLPKPVIWSVDVECPDCLIHSYKTETMDDIEGAGKFMVKLELMPGKEVKRLDVTAKSKQKLGGNIRSYSWCILPDFHHIHHFQFGHFPPTNGVLSLRAKFTTAFGDPPSPQSPLYVALVKTKDGSKTFSERVLDEGHWKEKKDFEMELTPFGDLKEYLEKNEKPTLQFVVVQRPICQNCQQYEKNGEKTLQKEKASTNFIHPGCHEKYAKALEEHQNRHGNCDCDGCRKKRKKKFKTYFDKETMEESEKFKAELEMPILQNGQHPFYTYEFDPAQPRENYNHVQLLHFPGTAAAAPGSSSQQAEKPSASSSSAVGSDISALELSMQEVWFSEHEKRKKGKEEEGEKAGSGGGQQQVKMEEYDHHHHYWPQWEWLDGGFIHWTREFNHNWGDGAGK